jgi:hypothetical protein
MKSDLTVFITVSESSCSECGEDLGRRAWITLVEEKGALCLACADLDHLVFLPAGDAALTRRSRKHSNLSAVVLRWSRARKRYERQGLLVEAEALDLAEQECLRHAGRSWTTSTYASLPSVCASCSLAVLPVGRSPLLNTPASSTAGGWVAQRLPRPLMSRRSGWPSWLMFGTQRRPMANSWPAAMIGGRHAPRWRLR